MTAPVRIEAEAWADLRFATLARILGLADLDHALIKVARIWSWQAEHYTPEAPTYVVDEDTIESALGVGGAAAMVRARLAEELPEGFRIKGTVGRIEWLHQRRAASAKGGGSTKRKWDNKTGPTGPRSALADQEGQPPAAAPRGPDRGSFGEVPDNGGPLGLVTARPGLGPGPGPKPGPLPLALVPEDLSSPDQGSSPEPPDPRAAVRAERVQGLPPPGVPMPGTRDRRVKLNHDAWAYAALEHARLRGDGITPSAVAWPAMPAGAPMSDLVERTREVLAQSDPPDFDAAAATMKRRIDVAVAEAKREQHLKWFTPTRLWDAKGFWRALEFTPEEAARPRMGPLPGGRDTPPTTDRRPLKRLS